MNPIRPLLSTRADIEFLMQQFYSKLLPDPVLGYLFTEVAQLDLASHLSILADFWETVLLGANHYRRNVMEVHLALNRKSPLLPQHFERWKALFIDTIDEYFSGDLVEEAKRRVELMSGLMQLKIEQSNNKGFIA